MSKKNHFIGIIAAALAIGAISCGDGGKNAEILNRQATRVNAELHQALKNDPALMSDAGAQYADSAFRINLVLADSLINVSDYSQALVEYFLSEEIKTHAGKDLDEIVNTLAKVKEPMLLTLTDVYGTTDSYELPAATLRNLYKTSRSQLRLLEVRSEVLAIMAGRSVRFAVGQNVQKVDFALTSSFATYTVIYDNAKAYSGLNVANLKARYLKILKPMYKGYGELADAIAEMDKSLGIDGYRFVLTTPSGDSELKATLPWREILAD
ncbi:MAG: hypothetical protein K2F77_09570 [Muribaculaceae bacterium]|nr:hypothetical protein [Muribaculaceae bacterium]